MRLNRAALAVSTAFSAVLLLGLAPAGADEEREEPTGQDTTCRDVTGGSAGHEVELTSDPPEGSEVRAGDSIAVSMVWIADDFTDAPLYDLLGCVTVDGALDETLSSHESDSSNRGEVQYRFTLPGTIRPGAEVCVRGAVAGDGNGYFERNITDDVCFTVAEDEAPEEIPPLPEATPVPPPPTPTPPAPNPAPMEAPPTVAGITSPEPPVEKPQRQAALPKTGPRQQLPLMLAGVLFAVGGALVATRPYAD